MKRLGYDVIGDIHGQFDKLVTLLGRLGYLSCGEGFRHPAGRRVIFLGDYIDRGPKVREVLVTVRAMVEGGDALAILGNHEYNAICYHTPNGAGGWLRARREDRDRGLRVTLEQFVGREEEWQRWLLWMRGLPLFLDLGELRAVHACWDEWSIHHLAGMRLTNDAVLRASAQPGTALFYAVDSLLNGPEMDMPEGYFLHDDQGWMYNRVRVRWWDVPEVARVGELALPVPFSDAGDATAEQLRRLPNYGRQEPPVFFGHYWLAADAVKAPLRDNVACLDFSAAYEGPLVAYRWDDERRLSAAKFVE